MLLSRLASHVFWLGRYVERSESMARAIIAHDRLCLDLPRSCASDTSYWSLFSLAGDGVIPSRPQEGRREILWRLIFDEGEFVGLVHSLSAARENLRSCRVLLPREAWDTLNPAYLNMKELAGTDSKQDIVDSLLETIAACERVFAQLEQTMIRDEAYEFIVAGRSLERADMLMRIIQVADQLGQDAKLRPFADVRWMGLLHSLGAHQMFRRVHRGRADARATLEFLLESRQFPKSLWFCLENAKRSLFGLPLGDDLAARLEELQDFPFPRDPTSPRAYTAHLIHGLDELSESIERKYFQRDEERRAS